MPYGGKKGFVRGFIAGGISAGVVKTTMAPIERVKIILQIQAIHKDISEKDAYKGIIDAFIRLPKEQGIFSMWRGNWANVLRYVPTQAMNFAFKDVYKKIFLEGVDKTKQYWTFFACNVAAGGTAGATSMLFIYPLDYARTRLAVDVSKLGTKKEYKGVYDCLYKTFKSDGLMGLYRGLNASIQGIFVYRGVYFGFYDSVKVLLPDPAHPSIINSVILANCVSLLAGLTSYPFDTVRRRLMMQSNVEEKDVIYKNTLDCWVKIYKNEGPRAYFKGALSNVLRGCGSALVLVLYDKVKRYL
ncbi:unnamed protein product [Psylliodes chrysocephalus]|uniref:ADP/ATP translocase n=1 Tax=Psylliodes chrysocephalus TaxID=3402493 RepID=A0A9P0D392_9CUCU|nr:unnamed protein product [Psylliodes chrysocephala]